jgi:peptidoglycan hydrolase FlgJ
MPGYVDIANLSVLNTNTLAGKADDPKRLKEACEEFEAILVQKMLESMRATVPEGGLLKKDSAQKIFEGMFDQQIARDIAQNGSFGLASTVLQSVATTNDAETAGK